MLFHVPQRLRQAVARNVVRTHAGYRSRVSFGYDTQAGYRTRRNIVRSHGEYPCHCLAQTLWYPSALSVMLQGILQNVGEVI